MIIETNAWTYKQPTVIRPHALCKQQAPTLEVEKTTAAPLLVAVPDNAAAVETDHHR
jgi:hypothetical protein